MSECQTLKLDLFFRIYKTYFTNNGGKMKGFFLLLLISFDVLAITNGQNFKDGFSDKYAVPIMSVFASGCDENGQAKIYTCGATRIAKNLLLTAGHCLSHPDKTDATKVLIWKDYKQMQKAWPKRNSKFCNNVAEVIPEDVDKNLYIEAEEIIFPSNRGYYWSWPYDVYDYAIIRISDDIDYNILPILPQSKLLKTKNYSIFGYGTNNCMKYSSEENDYVFEDWSTKELLYGAGVISLSSIANDLQQALWDKFYILNADNFQLVPKFRENHLMVKLESNRFICPGDSGSGLFAVDKKGIPTHVAGITVIPAWLDRNDYKTFGEVDSNQHFLWATSLQSNDFCSFLEAVTDLKCR